MAVVSEPSDDLKKCVISKEYESGAVITAKGQAIIPLSRNEVSTYIMPPELAEEDASVMLAAYEVGVMGAAPYISLLADDNGEPLKPHLLIARPVGSERHGRALFLAEAFCRVEWSRNNRIDRFAVEQVRFSYDAGIVQLERAILFDRSVGVSDYLPKPVLPALTGEHAKWASAAAAIRKRWKCSEPYCAAHFVA